MIEADRVMYELLDRAVPERDETAEWEDVLLRVGLAEEPAPAVSSQAPEARRRRRVVIAGLVAAAIAGLAASPVGTAIAEGIGNFSAWVRGDPGEPASPAEQHAFELANERSWTGFAPDAKLRRLIGTDASGTHFTLYGFRSGDDLCLRLVATGAVDAQSQTDCAPLHALQLARTPAVVVATDEPLGRTDAKPNADGFVPEAYSATFGIASDGVSKVSLTADDGQHPTLVGGNAFLYVADHPTLGTRVRHAEAFAVDGSRVDLPLQASPYGYFDLPAAPKGEAQGPTEVERKVGAGTIGWIERGEERGEPIPDKLMAKIRPIVGRKLSDSPPVLARLIKPDPNDYIRIGILAGPLGTGAPKGDRVVCPIVIDPTGMGGGCAPLRQLFEQRPFAPVGGSVSGADQYAQFEGLVSDGVAQMKVFLASGVVVTIPIHDNAYVARVGRSDFPARFVAYDRDGGVIGIQTVADDGMTSPAPAEAKSSVRELARVTGDGGAAAVLEAGTPAGGYRCWTISFSDGGTGGGCTPWPSKEKPLLFVGPDHTGTDVFVTGELPPSVDLVAITLPDGIVAKVAPIDGFVMYAVPGRFVQGRRLFLALRAFDANGKQIDQRGVHISW
jgi:hypothetical protein